MEILPSIYVVTGRIPNYANASHAPYPRGFKIGQILKGTAPHESHPGDLKVIEVFGQNAWQAWTACVVCGIKCMATAVLSSDINESTPHLP